MALVNRTKTHHLTTKELRTFKFLVFFICVVYGLVLPLWFVFYGHSFLRDNERWTDIVVAKTRVSRTGNVDTKHVERRTKDIKNYSKMKDEYFKKTDDNMEFRKHRAKSSEISSEKNKTKKLPLLISFKKPDNKETGKPQRKFNEISSDKNETRKSRSKFSEIFNKKTNNDSKTRTLFNEISSHNTARLLSMKWDEVCCQSVNCLRKYPLFPLLSSETRFLRTLRVPITGHLYGERILGRLSPPETGIYSFVVKCLSTCELWLGDNEYPRSSRLFIKIVHGTGVNTTEGQKPNFDVMLSSRKRYFIDILFTVYRKSYHPFEVFWKIPSTGKYSLITQEFFSGFVKKPRSLRTTINVFSNAPSTQLTPFLEAIEEAGEDDDDFKIIGDEKNSNDTFYDLQGIVIPVNTSFYPVQSLPLTKSDEFHNMSIFPHLRRCNYSPASIVNSSLAKYEGVWKTSVSAVFPNDKTGLMMCIGNRYPADCQGNERIPTKTVQKVLSLYTYAINKYNQRRVKKPRYSSLQTELGLKVTTLVNIVQKTDPLKGSSFLLDVVLTDLQSNATFLHSQYLYMDKEETTLCYPSSLTINLNRAINVVVVAKGQSRWLRHFLANMENIYLNTNDKHLNIIIAKYGRDDTKLMEEYARTRLPSIRTVRNFGKFHKTKAIQAAVDTIQDQNSIVFLMDLHILVPDTMMALIRKHTIREKMVFNPILFRLSHCGSQATSTKPPRGFWETFGYGILGIYKSDWDRIGGMNSKEYSHGWGGEDWELLDRIVSAGLEVDRLRVPNFYHFYHSKTGMWN